MTQLTIRGFDPQLERAIRGLAEREGVSLNKAAIRLLQRGAGLGDPAKSAFRARIGSRLDRFVGLWSDEEADAFDAAVEDLRRVDPDFWE